MLGDRPIDRFEQFGEPALAHCNGRDDRDAEETRELCHVDPAAEALDLVHHVQADDKRHAQLGQLGHQVEVALEVGGVHNTYHGVRGALQDGAPGDEFLG